MAVKVSCMVCWAIVPVIVKRVRLRVMNIFFIVMGFALKGKGNTWMGLMQEQILSSQKGSFFAVSIY